MRFATYVVVVVLTSYASQVECSVIENGSFEDGLDGWYWDSFGYSSVSTATGGTEGVRYATLSAYADPETSQSGAYLEQSFSANAGDELAFDYAGDAWSAEAWIMVNIWTTGWNNPNWYLNGSNQFQNS